MKILLLSRYGRLGASSRLRAYQYLPALKNSEMNVVVAPFFSDDYVKSILQGKNYRHLLSILRSYFLRLLNILKHRSVDCIWIEYEVFPWLPYFVEKLIMKRGVSIVVDYDDAVFHKYDLNRYAFIRLALGKKIAEIMINAKVVIVGNGYLMDYAISAGARDVFSLPTVIDLERYQPRDHDADDLYKVGWIGSPTTIKYLDKIYPVFKVLDQDGNFRLHLIGSDHSNIPGIPIHISRWSEETEVSEISEFDVGIMPLADNPWERGKCGYKLIQYMACGKPVIASPVGINKEIVDHGVNGFLADSNDEWLQALRVLRDNPALRTKMGRAGREKVREKYSLQVAAPQLISLFKKLRKENN